MEVSIIISVLIVGVSTLHAFAALSEKDEKGGKKPVKLFVFFLTCSFILALSDIYFKWEKEQQLKEERELDKANSLRIEEEAKLRHEEVLRNINKQLLPYNMFYSDKSGVLEVAVPNTTRLETELVDSTKTQSKSGFGELTDKVKIQPNIGDTRVPIIEETVYPDIEMEDSACKDLNTINGSVYGVIKFINRTSENLEIFRASFVDEKFIRVNSGRSGITQKLQISVLDREGNFNISSREHVFYFRTVGDNTPTKFGKMFITAKACKQVTIEISDYNLTLSEDRPR